MTNQVVDFVSDVKLSSNKVANFLLQKSIKNFETTKNDVIYADLEEHLGYEISLRYDKRTKDFSIEIFDVILEKIVKPYQITSKEMKDYIRNFSDTIVSLSK